MRDEVPDVLDPIRLLVILESLKHEKAVSEIALELKLANDQTTIKRLSATIRLMGYSVVAKAVWCRDRQNSTRQATVQPKL